MTKRFISMALMAVVAAGVLFAGGKSDSGAGKKPYVIWVNPLVGSSVFTSADNGITQASKDFDFRLKIIGPSVLVETEMNQAMENALAEKPDVIVTTPYNYSAFRNVYLRAKERGITMIDISSDSPANERLSFIGTDNTTYGRLAADYLAEKQGGKANVLIMMSKLDTSNQLEQKTSFEATIKAKYPNMKLVLTDEDQADSATAVRKFTEILRSRPEIDTIMCLESIGGAAAAVVLKEMNLVGKVTVLAVDDNKDTLQYIRDGVLWGTMAQNFYKMGYLAGKHAIQHLNGTSVPSVMDSGTVLITKSNIDTYTDVFYKMD